MRVATPCRAPRPTPRPAGGAGWCRRPGGGSASGVPRPGHGLAQRGDHGRPGGKMAAYRARRPSASKPQSPAVGGRPRPLGSTYVCIGGAQVPPGALELDVERFERAGGETGGRRRPQRSLTARQRACAASISLNANAWPRRPELPARCHPRPRRAALGPPPASQCRAPARGQGGEVGAHRHRRFGVLSREPRPVPGPDAGGCAETVRPVE